ncbi:hypothetical protein WA158_001315 [Blastocystis sp. Blastoise]
MRSLLIVLSLIAFASAIPTFEVRNQTFYKDGEKFQYVSGSFHYFRVHPDRWDDTFKKMAAGGLNAVQTYVAWNLHEPKRGEFNFEGFADIERWLQLAQKNGLVVIMRPGPYICAEWDFGGLPYWLVKEEGIDIRTKDEKYVKAVDEWFNVLLPKLKPYLYEAGGPIISVQVENEYGFYPKCDKEYMGHLRDLNREILGKNVVLFTVDTFSDSALSCGNVDGVYMTVDFGVTDVANAYGMQRKYEKVFPLVNTEYYPGWLDHWEEKHHTVSTENVVQKMEDMLNMGGNVNYYMYIGGTNFAFFNGANGDSNSYQADPTSYDYDAPLSEAGDITHKWEAIRDSIKKYRPVPELNVKNSSKVSYGTVPMKEGISFWDAYTILAPEPVKSEEPLSFEIMDIDFGYVLYTTDISEEGELSIPVVHDRAYVYVDQKYIDTLTRTGNKKTHIPAGHLEILVENMGRINFGGQMTEFKGLPQGVLLNDQSVKNWVMFGITMKDLSSLKFSTELPTSAPAFFRTVFEVKELGDTFLNPNEFKKGVAWINKFNLGRYWTVGPQLTLYVPQPVLKEGENELIIFEAEHIGDSMTLQDTPVIDI